MPNETTGELTTITTTHHLLAGNACYSYKDYSNNRTS